MSEEKKTELGFEDNSEEKASRWDKIKAHVKRNEDRYTGFAAGAVTSAVLFGLHVHMNGTGRGQVSISNPALINIKPESTTNQIQVNMLRPGPKSHVVQCIETGAVFPSIRQAGRDLGIPASVISGHLNGKLDNAGGLHFDKIDEL